MIWLGILLTVQYGKSVLVLMALIDWLWICTYIVWIHISHTLFFCVSVYLAWCWCTVQQTMWFLWLQVRGWLRDWHGPLQMFLCAWFQIVITMTFALIWWNPPVTFIPHSWLSCSTQQKVCFNMACLVHKVTAVRKEWYWMVMNFVFL